MTFKNNNLLIVKLLGHSLSNVKVYIYDEDAPLTDELLDELKFSLFVPRGAFKGALIPYKNSFKLRKSRSGDVEGKKASSGEKEAEVYQEVEFSWSLNPESKILKVKAK